MARNAVLVLGHDKVMADLFKAAERYQKRSHTRKLIRPAAQKFRNALSRRIGAYSWARGKTSKSKQRSTGAMARSIKTFSFGRSQGVHVGPRVGVGPKGPKNIRGLADGFHMGWHEFGTKTNGRGHGIRPKGFMQKTLATHGAKVNNMMRQALMKDFKYLM